MMNTNAASILTLGSLFPFTLAFPPRGEGNEPGREIMMPVGTEEY